MKIDDAIKLLKSKTPSEMTQGELIALRGILSEFQGELESAITALASENGEFAKLWQEDGGEGPAILKSANKPQKLVNAVPKTHYKPNNKLANEIAKDFVGNGEQALYVGRKSSANATITTVTLEAEGKGVTLTGRASFAPYDREALDGVTSLYEAGNRAVTAAMVYRAMNGMSESEHVSRQSAKAVTESLEKSRRIMAHIDFAQEARAYSKDVENAVLEGCLLACDKIYASVSGSVQVAYRLLRPPILYEYAQLTGQILSIPISLLQTSRAVRNTEEVIVIRGYLLRQVEGMKPQPFMRSSKIAYAGIYKELGMERIAGQAFNDKPRKARSHVEAILGDWAPKGYIKGFEAYKEGRAYKGVAIKL